VCVCVCEYVSVCFFVVCDCMIFLFCVVFDVFCLWCECGNCLCLLCV